MSNSYSNYWEEEDREREEGERRTEEERVEIGKERRNTRGKGVLIS